VLTIISAGELQGLLTAMRVGYRSVCLLGNPAVEDSIRRELERQFPADHFPVNIDVVGTQHNTSAMVRVTNLDCGINVSERAIPQSFRPDTLSAVIETVKTVIAELREAGKLPPSR
jgi:hypothetical protein